MKLQNALKLNYSLFFGSWSSGIWNDIENCTESTLESGPWSLVLWDLEWGCKLLAFFYFSLALGPWSPCMCNAAANCTCSAVQSCSWSLILRYLKWCCNLHSISNSVWCLVIGPLVFGMRLQTAHSLHFSLVLSPWSLVLGPLVFGMRLQTYLAFSPLYSGPWSLVT
jgi:hypothetical protein